jgi:catechol-2,3-dioxygenase
VKRVIARATQSTGNETGGKGMIREVPLVGIFVNDQGAALEFYTDKLGLEKVQDEPYGEGARWITVSPSGSRPGSS